MSLSLYVILWAVSLIAVFFLGRHTFVTESKESFQQQKEAVIIALEALLEKTEQLSSDVDTRNSELESVEQSIEELNLDGELAQIGQKLQKQIHQVIESNQQLEYDLNCTKYELDLQAQELDKTHLEARTDILSGISNRKGYEEAIAYFYSRYKKEKTPFSLVLADIDYFKRINDTYGHLTGDSVIENIGDLVKRVLRDEDIAARFGGDEFVFIFPNLENDKACALAEQLRKELEQTSINLERAEKDLNGEGVAVTFSIGVATICAEDTLVSLKARADQALYQSKRKGKNQVTLVETKQVVVGEPDSEDHQTKRPSPFPFPGETIPEEAIAEEITSILSENRTTGHRLKQS